MPVEDPLPNRRRETVLVVGGGLGGLSVAASLAAEGFHVVLHEKNSHLGGKLNLHEEKGFKFDLGPSILILPQIFARLFERAGKRMEDYVPLERVEPQWRSVYEDGTVLDLYGDFVNMERELRRFSDEDSAGYYAFVEYSRRLFLLSEATVFDRGDDTTLEILRGYNPVDLLHRLDITRSMSQGVSRFIKEPHLKQMLDFFIKYVGSSAIDAPAVLNLMLYSQLGWGLWYVTGGMFNLSRGLTRLIDELGVEVHLNSEVVRIVADGKQVTGIELKDGRVVPADIVVSNMEVIPAYQRLLREDPEFMKRYDRYEPACSGLVIHLGVNRHYPELRHHCFFFSGDQKKHFNDVFHKKELPEDPTIYLVNPTYSDRTIAPEGHEIIKILPHIPHIQDPPFSREEYALLKERVYDKLERMGLRDLRRHIVVEHMLVPEDLERLYYSNKGAIYGVVADRFKNLGLKAPKTSEKYDNLYFVGGSVNPGGGMPMVILSGQQVRDKILRRYA